MTRLLSAACLLMWCVGTSEAQRATAPANNAFSACNAKVELPSASLMRIREQLNDIAAKRTEVLVVKPTAPEYIGYDQDSTKGRHPYWTVQEVCADFVVLSPKRDGAEERMQVPLSSIAALYTRGTKLAELMLR